MSNGKSLLQRSMQIGADYIATGHYARIEQLQNGRYAIRNSVTAAKDQTYALYNLTQRAADAYTLMPVGAYEKSTGPHDWPRKLGLCRWHTRRTAMEICFRAGSATTLRLSRRYSGKDDSGGQFRDDRTGKSSGVISGITHYTVGQRKGLGISRLGRAGYL